VEALAVNLTPLAFKVPKTCKYTPELNLISTPLSMVTVTPSLMFKDVVTRYGLLATVKVVLTVK
jgi:hypothetical protein